MKTEKNANICASAGPTAAQMEKINLQSKVALKAEDVYVFAVRLCDDQVDRDYERFDTGALEELGQLFVGKPGIVDHNWSADKQTARIFDTEVVHEPAASWLKGWVYILRAGREDLIADIESGMRKEVSISCSMAVKECSICGGHLGACGHRAGGTYDGKVCVGILKEPRDAYEFSFVAVPAQPKAGVVKHWKGGESMDVNLKAFVQNSGIPALEEELESLSKRAAYGDSVRKQRIQEVTRMGVALELGLSREDWEGMALRLENEPLEKLRKGLSDKMEALRSSGLQLTAGIEKQETKEAYLI